MSFAAYANYITKYHWTCTVEEGSGSKDANGTMDQQAARNIETFNGHVYGAAWHDNAALEKNRYMSLGFTQYMVDAGFLSVNLCCYFEPYEGKDW